MNRVEQLPESEDRITWLRGELEKWTDLKGQLTEWIVSEIEWTIDDFDSLGELNLSFQMKLDFWNSITVEGGLEQAITGIMLNKDKRNFTSVIEAFTSGENHRREFLLWRIREYLRDGITSKRELLKHYSESICGFAMEGDDVFFEKLGRTLENPPEVRTLGSWVIRAWLPLRLWECGNYLEAYGRFNPVAESLGKKIKVLDFEIAFKNARRTRNGDFYNKFKSNLDLNP